MTRLNKPIKTDKRMSDYDACALYPSAMNRAYYPAGKPVKLTKEECKYWEKHLFDIQESPIITYGGCPAVLMANNRIKDDDDDDCNEGKTLFLEVKIKKISKEVGFPLLSYQND